MRRVAMIGLWVLATAITTAVAYVAVNAAGASVTDRPLTAFVADTSTTSVAGVVDTTEAVATTTRPTTSTTTDTTVTAGPINSTTSTTAGSAPWEQTTVNSTGGAVIVSSRPNEVRLESVVPLAGFGYEIDEAGPSEVRVEFEGGDLKVEIRIRWENGVLTTEVDDNS